MYIVFIDPQSAHAAQISEQCRIQGGALVPGVKGSMNIGLLSAKWISQTDPFRLAQISPARRNETRDENKNLDWTYENQIC